MSRTLKFKYTIRIQTLNGNGNKVMHHMQQKYLNLIMQLIKVLTINQNITHLIKPFKKSNFEKATYRLTMKFQS